jgi:hypothetical protein
VEAWINKISEVVTTLNDPKHDDRKKYVETLKTLVPILKELAGEAAEGPQEDEIDAPLFEMGPLLPG